MSATLEWVLERHSGRAGADWHQIWKGYNEARGVAKYLKIEGELRQGGVRLIDPHGSVVMLRCSPRLRTRW